MPRRARQLSTTSVYHVMLRGVNREVIFLEQADLERFIHQMSVVAELSSCHILAYCLMSNHVHLIIQTTAEPIGLVIKRLGVRYAGWFNKKYNRVGHLFQDRFRSVPVEDDAYLITLLSYVWNNPVAAGLVERAEDYPWSSRRYLGQSMPWVDHTALRRLVPTEALDEAANPTKDAPTRDSHPSRPQLNRFEDDEVTGLMKISCGASTSREFLKLERSEQDRVVRRLRTMGVPHRQIARATGLSATTVRRRQMTDL